MTQTQQTKNVALSLQYIKRLQVVEWTKKFVDRFYTRMSNNFPIMVIKDVTYDEMMQLIEDYVMHMEFGTFHIITENYYFAPHEHVMLTAK